MKFQNLTDADITTKGTVALGTVEGDLHDIGKNLVSMMLESGGYNIVDVGVDANVETFVKAVQESDAIIVAMSGLLTMTMPYFRNVIEGLQEARLKDRVKVMIGGASVTREYADEIGAEGFAGDCVSAVDEANRIMTHG